MEHYAERFAVHRGLFFTAFLKKKKKKKKKTGAGSVFLLDYAYDYFSS